LTFYNFYLDVPFDDFSIVFIQNIDILSVCIVYRKRKLFVSRKINKSFHRVEEVREKKGIEIKS